jgi:chromosome segregation protein
LQLRKLEICGFKSFMSRLELDFTAGITSILGPNGCGKSNVVDSIRWVLGEQRTRLLRNSKMENVLFNGTRLRKPLGMAEVYLTLSNEDHGLSVDYEEVTIGRKLYRSGVSEYLINGEVTRLKEIRNLLVDTGLGNNAYAIIERDMIDKVLSDKDQDKRALLEEAAGIMRYRIQREEALRKIKLTEQDLQRLADIIQELDKELRSLKYQMAKARRYTRMKERANKLETSLLKATLFDLLVRKDALEKEREVHQNVRLADDNEISIRESRLQESRIKASEFERSLQGLHEKRYNASSALQQREEKIAVTTERIAANKGRITENDGEIARARERMVVLAGDLEGHHSEVSAREARLDELRKTLNEREGEARELSRELDAARDDFRARKQLVLDLVEEKAKEKSLREHIGESLKTLAEKQRSIENQLEELSREETRRVVELSAAEEHVEAARAAFARGHETLDQLTAAADRMTEEAAGCERDLSEAARAHAQLREKREFLERVVREHTKWTSETLGRFAGLEGVLSDLVRVDKRYRRCFEACLAPVLNGVVASSRENAIACVRELHRQGWGRVQVLYAFPSVGAKTEVTGDGVVGAADSLVSLDPAVADCLGEYLSGIAVVRDVDAAIALIRDGRASRVATLDGVFFDGPGRIVVAGSDEIETTVLEHATKLDELQQVLAAAADRVREAESRRDGLDRGRESVRREIAAARDEVSRAEAQLQVLLEKKRDCELAVVRVKEKIAGLEDTRDESKAAVAKLKGQVSGPPDGRETPAVERDLVLLEETTLNLERRKESISELVGKLRMENVSVAGEVETLRTKIRNFEKLEEELRQLTAVREEDSARCREQVRLGEEDIVSLRASIADFYLEKESVEKEIATAAEGHEELKGVGEAIERELKGMKEQREANRENLERVSVELASLEARISGLVERAQEDFGQDLRLYVRDRSQLDPSQWERLDRDGIARLKQQVESFGPVNMLALDEYNEKKERYDFLCKQKEDLEGAKNDLAQAIRRINREARRLFSETFELVRENFKRTFLTLFDGGEVELMFTDSEDPLEANIKIVANPKGKKLHDISSLSSGERALVALSLLFAIYLVKPSPFCVFDEVDAPLDDANVNRFVRLLESFTARTQFIVITHNKKTMEAADHLYGVTMEEPGVSKLVSVRLDEAERFRRHQPQGAGLDRQPGSARATPTPAPAQAPAQ